MLQINSIFQSREFKELEIEVDIEIAPYLRESLIKMSNNGIQYFSTQETIDFLQMIE